MTITKGNYSGKIEDGVKGEYYKTDGNLSGGVSGGAAFNSDGVFIGVPSAHYSDSSSNAYIGLIKPSRFAAELISKVKP
jgi:S1-C subfamily serine protease